MEFRIELTPQDNRKRFYGKCYAINTPTELSLYSYGRLITTINKLTKQEIKTNYYNYSMTTKRHQKAFYALAASM